MPSGSRQQIFAKRVVREDLRLEIERLAPVERVSRLADALRADGDDEQRAWAARELGKLGTVARSASPMLRPLTRHSHNGLRTRAVEALGRIGDDSEATLVLLGEALFDAKECVAEAAGSAIAAFGERAFPFLREAFVSTRSSAREAALRAAGRIGGATLVDEVLGQVAVPPPVSSLALATAARLAPEDHRVVRACIEQLDSPVNVLREAGANALRGFGESGRRWLREALHHSRADVADFAAVILLDRGEVDEEILGRVVEGLEAKLPYVRRRCIEAIGRLDVVSSELEARLAKLRAEDADKLTRKAGRHAATALRKCRIALR